MLLVGDIGGTKTILAMYSAENGPSLPLVEKSYPSAHYDSLETIIRSFLSSANMPIKRACFGVAGPVMDGCARITNLPWWVDAASLKKEFDLKQVKLLNDMQAVGHSVPVLKPDDLSTLHPGEPIKGGSIAILAPGTGLGEGFLTFSGDSYQVNPSEGSHVSFGPTDELQMDLLRYMRTVKGFDHVSYERVCSGGLGIPNLYDFFKETGRYSEPKWLADELAQSEDPTPVIIRTALDQKNPCDLCTAILDLFISILAAEAGNLALKVLSTGGIYLGGGIPPRILDQLSTPEFLKTIRNKGRFDEILAKMPVYVITHPNAGMLGAAAYGLA